MAEPENESGQLPSCSVAEAASRLGCTEQSVRNWIDSGRLQGFRVTVGQRTNIRRVVAASVEKHRQQHGPGRASTASGGWRATVENRLAELECDVSNASGPRKTAKTPETVDNVNLQFANMQLLQIHENYETALRESLVADSHRKAALEALTAAAAGYRAIVEQFHLPTGPPAE